LLIVVKPKTVDAITKTKKFRNKIPIILSLTRIKIDLQLISLIIDLVAECFERLIKAPIIISNNESNCLFSSDDFDDIRSILIINSPNLLIAFCSHKYGIIVCDKAKFLINPTVALRIPQ
jgi:hypothetical protein